MKKIFLFAALIMSLTSCIKEPKCEYNECAITAPASEIQDVQTYLQSNNITATQHCSGVFYAIEQQGSGTRPKACSNVLVNYEGKLTNGTVFDKTEPNQPADFNLSGLIPGFRNALLQIKAGGKITFYIPPSLGYGDRQNGSIPANSILIFTVELLDVQ